MQTWAESFYKSRAWRECRDAYAASVGGLCELCLARGLHTAGVIVHHKVHLTPDNIHLIQLLNDRSIIFQGSVVGRDLCTSFLAGLLFAVLVSIYTALTVDLGLQIFQRDFQERCILDQRRDDLQLVGRQDGIQFQQPCIFFADSVLYGHFRTSPFRTHPLRTHGEEN